MPCDTNQDVKTFPNTTILNGSTIREALVPLQPLAADNGRSPRGSFITSLREFLFGMMGYEITQHAVEMRASLESLFMAITVGDIVGLPIIPPYYALRLVPYVVPQMQTWKRRVLRERDFTEDHEYDLHGL